MFTKRAFPIVAVVSILLLSVHGGPIGSGFAITDASNDQVRASIAYNSQRQEYLVVWQNEWQSGSDTNQNLAGQRVSKNGALAGTVFNIYSGSGNAYSADVAYDSQHDEYLVVWEHYETSSHYSIRARLISGTGQVYTLDIVITGPGYNLYSPVNPAVAYSYTSDKYLVVWEEAFHPTVATSIMGQVVSSAGALEGSSFTISQDPGGGYRRQPDLAYNRSRNEYLAAWQQQVGGDYDIYARRVTGNGVPLQPESILISNISVDEIAPAVAAIPATPNQGDYLVAWEYRYTASDGDIYARAVAGDGTAGTMVTVAEPTTNQTNPAVDGSESSQQYLVTWSHPSDPPFIFVGIRGRAVSTGAALLGKETGLGGLFADHSAVAAGLRGDFLVAYDDVPLTSDRDVYGRMWGNRIYLPLVVRDH